MSRAAALCNMVLYWYRICFGFFSFLIKREALANQARSACCLWKPVYFLCVRVTDVTVTSVRCDTKCVTTDTVTVTSVTKNRDFWAREARVKPELDFWAREARRAKRLTSRARSACYLWKPVLKCDQPQPPGPYRGNLWIRNCQLHSLWRGEGDLGPKWTAFLRNFWGDFGLEPDYCSGFWWNPSRKLEHEHKELALYM